MRKQRKIVFCGKSLTTAGLEASLHGKPGLDTLWLGGDLPDVIEQLAALTPDVLVVDLGDGSSEHVLTCLRELPGVAVIGLDLTANTSTVISSQKFTTRTVPDLAALLECEVLTRSQRAREQGPTIQRR